MISITILSFDRKSDIKNCIESLYHFTDMKKTPFEVIVIDQNSNKETKSYLKSILYTNLKIVFLKENIGCARGRKKALEICSQKSNFIFQADNDIIFSKNWLNQMLIDINRNSRIGALQARCIAPTDDVLLSGGIIERFDLQGKRNRNGYIAIFKDNGSSRHKKPDRYGLLFCDYVSGGATLYKKELLEDISLNINFLNGYEDYDLSIMARKKGWLLACDYNIALMHNNRRFKEPNFARKEARYIKTRENSATLFTSLLEFIKKHKINPIRSDGFDSIIKDENEIPFAEYSNQKLKFYFDKIIKNQLKI